MRNIFGKRLFSVLITSLFLTIGIFSQDLDDVNITGKVVDTNGAAIVGATVTATQIERGIERTVTTNDDGRYRIIELQPGTYKIAVSQTGFETKEKVDLQTLSGQSVQLDFKLDPAGVVVDPVEVTAEDASPVDTTRTVVGGTVTQREVEELPNDSRNPLDLVFTLGGVTEEPLSTRDLSGDRGTRGSIEQRDTPEEAGIFALSGGAAYSNNITIDGLDNNDDRTASFRFQPSIESVAEVQVITNQFSAEYGRASGGRVNIRTRAGNNRYRGRAFFFYRDDKLNANTWNNNRRGIERPPFTNYVPGFTLGGPIVKKKLFFFSAYEYDRIQEDTIIDVFVPVNNTSSFSLPAPTNPTQFVPVINGSGSTCNIGVNCVLVAPFIQPVDTPRRQHIFSTRIDWNLNAKNNFTFGFQLGRLNDLRQFSGTNRLADSLIGRVRDTEAYNASYNLILNSKTVNQVRFQFSKLRPTSTPNSGAQAPVILITFNPPEENTSTQIYSASTSGSSDRKEDRFQIQNTLTRIVGSHNLSFGGDYQRVKSQFIDRFDATGTYRFTNFFFFSQNSVSSFQQNFNTESRVNNSYTGVFAQDDWRVLPNLTFSFGLRYERESVINDNNNFAPRVAVAWNPFKKTSKTVLRAGAGIFYNRALLRTVDDFTAGSQEIRFDTRNQFPMGTDIMVVRNFLNSQFPNALTLDTIVPLDAMGRSATVRELSAGNLFRDLDPTLKIPESYQFNVGFERELFKGLVFETNYTINKTVRLWRDVNINAPVLPAGTIDRNGDGVINFSDYLRGFSGVIPLTTGITQFEFGSLTDPVGIRMENGIRIINLNTTNNNNSTTFSGAPTSTAVLTYAALAIRNLRPLASQGFFGERERISPIGKSFYQGITFELRNRYRTFKYGFGGSMRFVYTLAKLNDDGIVNTSSAQINGDFESDYSRSLLDRRHRIAFSGTFDTPSWLGKLRLSPLFRFGSSAPFNLSIGGNDRNLDDVSNDRPNFGGNLGEIDFRKLGSPYPQALANQFTLAPIGSPGNLPRNAGNGPRQYIFDLNVSREFKFGERIRLRPTVEFDNLFNLVAFSFGSNFINFANLNAADLRTNPSATDIRNQANARATFLASTRTFRPRRIRLGIRFDF